MNQNPARTLFTWIFLAAFVFAPAHGLGQQFQPTDYIPSSAIAAIDCKPKDAIAQPSMEIIPHELIKVFGEQEFGLDLLEISRLTLVVDQLTEMELKDPPEFGVIVRFETPQTLAEKFTEEFERSTLQGKTLYQQRKGSILILDDKTILLGSSAFIPKMLSARGAKSPLISLIQASKPTDHLNTYLVMEPVR